MEPMHARERRQSVGIHGRVREEVYEPPAGEDHARGRKFWHPVEHQHQRAGREVDHLAARRAPQPHGIIRGCQRRAARERLDGPLDSVHTVTQPAIHRRLCRVQRPERLGRADRPHRARRVRGRPRPRRAVCLAWSARAMRLGAPHARCRPRVPPLVVVARLNGRTVRHHHSRPARRHPGSSPPADRNRASPDRPASARANQASARARLPYTA